MSIGVNGTMLHSDAGRHVECTRSGFYDASFSVCVCFKKKHSVTRYYDEL